MLVSSSDSSVPVVPRGGKKKRCSVDIIHYYSDQKAPRRENKNKVSYPRAREEEEGRGEEMKEKKKVRAAFTGMNERQKALSAHQRVCESEH